MPELTDQQWEDIQRTLGPVRANAWLAKRNRALAAELPPTNPAQPPVYQTPQPVAALPSVPQGTAPMPNPPSGALPSAPQGTAQAPTPASGALPTIADLLAEQNAISGDTIKFIERVRDERKKNYDLETEELKKRRFGPSSSEQWFRLAAAIGKPTYDRSFGSIMANVTPALAEMEASKRNAEVQRAEAARALRQKYLSDLDETELAVLGERRKAADARVPIITAMTKGNPAKYDPSPKGGYTQRPGTGDLPGMPEMDQYGNYVIQDIRQIAFLPPNTPIIRPGDNPLKPKYVPAR